MVGRQLGGYAVSARIGVGGMGEVYRARDTKLQRDVAIKVLPRSLTSETEWVARFEREARILAALNHPNVAAIYGFEQWDDVHGLVLELVEGPTLEERLSTQDLSVFDALTFARQIIEALDAAHEKGIVHRDLKPANIKIRTDGVVKVLDFGLAQTVARNGIAADLSEATTTIADHTGESVILGTVPYMSPEQVRGQLVDKRSDIWAFGCVVYEMLTRRAPFKGETVSDTVAAILEREPNWSALPGAAPASVHRLLERCLEKDPKRRLRDIADALADIERPTLPLDVAAAPRRIGHTIERAALLALVVALSLFGWWSGTRPLSREFLQLPMDLGSHVLDPGRGPTAAISPDGSRVVYLGKGQRGAVQLFVRSLNQDFAIPLAGTEGAASPFFSPDGHAVAFFAGNALKQVLLQGGRPVEICKVPSSRGGSWAEDGNIIAPLDAATPLYRIPSTGGGPQVLTALNEDRTHRWPHIVPGAAAVIFTASAVIGDFEDATIEIQSLKSNRRSTLVRGGYFGRYVPGGHLAYLSHGTLYAAPLDVERQELTGPAVPLIENVRTLVQSGGAVLDVSPSGALIYAKGSPPRQELAWLDGTGHIEPLGTPAARYDYGVRFSPDGQRIALSSPAAAFDVWAFDLQRAVMIRLTSAPENDMVPVWTPGGRHVVFMCFREATDNICRVRADGSGGELRLMTAKGSLRPYSFSPDGRSLVFGEVRADTKGDLWIVRIDDVDGDRPRAHEPVPFLNTPFNEQAAMISPDGTWISYQSDETGTDEIYVRSFPEGSRQTLVSIGGGSAPVWSRTRPELFYRSSDGLNKVTYTAKGGVFAPDKPRAWAPGKGLGQWFDISPTDRAVIISGVEESLPPQLMLVLGFDELRRRATEGVRR